MERLPGEVIAYIFDHLHAAHALSPAMLACRQWYMYGARNLYARLVLSFGFDLTMDSSNVVISLMRRLISPTLATAHFVRHLRLFGIANQEIQPLILTVLRNTTALRSLDIHALHVLENDTLLPADVFLSPEMLPNLTALNVSSAPFLESLARTRKVHALRVHKPMNHETLSQLSGATGTFATRLQFLELAISIDHPAAAVEEVAYLVSILSHAPLCALALQFVLDRPGLMSWADFEDVIGQMGPSLQTLPSLNTLSLVIRPDPIMSTPISVELGSGDSQRELRTRMLAERLIADHHLSQLRRIELRWHGWKVSNGALVALPRTDLLRLPQSWIYEQFSGSLR
ncbi:hypothetical protein BD414DRAFT_412665 [Trametes punicea]|nr:hypothetical protein BD414DRAFT_412665 [Trametes punicea]